MTDLYSTQVLVRVVESLKRPTSFFLDNFFPTVVTTEAEEIVFDVMAGARRISPFVSPLVEGKVVEGLGRTAKKFSPAYVKDKRALDPNYPLKRAAGEMIGGGSLTAGQREAAYVTMELADQLQMLTRRKEIMAVEALRTGKVTVTGDGYPTVVVDFGRAGGHTVALTGGNRWGETGVKEWEGLEGYCDTVAKSEGATITDVVMDLKAWRLFVADTDVQNALDWRRSVATGPVNSGPGQRFIGAQFRGSIGARDFWTHQDWYINDAGSEVAMLPDWTVLLVDRASVSGYQAHGAIRDPGLNYAMGEAVPKSWITNDPAVRYLMLQSAPLVVPFRPNATFAVTVHDGL